MRVSHCPLTATYHTSLRWLTRPTSPGSLSATEFSSYALTQPGEVARMLRKAPRGHVHGLLNPAHQPTRAARVALASPGALRAAAGGQVEAYLHTATSGRDGPTLLSPLWLPCVIVLVNECKDPAATYAMLRARIVGSELGQVQCFAPESLAILDQAAADHGWHTPGNSAPPAYTPGMAPPAYSGGADTPPAYAQGNGETSHRAARNDPPPPYPQAKHGHADKPKRDTSSVSEADAPEEPALLQRLGRVLRRAAGAVASRVSRFFGRGTGPRT